MGLQALLRSDVEVGRDASQLSRVTQALLGRLNGDTGHDSARRFAAAPVVPTLPHWCGSEAPSLCGVELCQYSVPDYLHPASWYHFGVEGPFTETYYN
jgi:hypothetical protein